MDPVTKLLLAIDAGERTLAMAQGVVHQVVQMLAPGCVPLFLTLTITHNFRALREQPKGQVGDNKKGAADNTL
jgi:hypothetical protein